MIKPLVLAIGLAAVCVGQAVAEGRKVVIELYTSQGCSSCPPADKILRELAKRGDVIALALHVDYWDYIGWKDVFGSPENTERQRAYARAAGSKTIYTPQMVIGGVDHVVGARPMQVMDQIERHKTQPAAVALDIARKGGNLAIRAKADGKLPSRMVVQLVRYTPNGEVAIKRGENAGKTINYTNIVTSWDVVDVWNGRAPLELTVPAQGGAPVVVIIQADRAGPILAAAEIK